MNVIIVAVCVNFITLVNAAHDINFDTVLKILKLKHRKSGYSNIDETNESIEAIPIIPGFYLQRPKDLSKSLFENAKDWPDDRFNILSSEDTNTRHNNARISAKAFNKNPRDDYLKDKILEAVKNLNKYRDMQKYKKDILKKSNAYGAQKEPVKKLLGRVFQGIKGGIDYRGKGKYMKPRNQTISSRNEKKIGKLLKNLLYGSINNKKYHGSQKYQYDETEENSQNTGDLLGSIVDAIQNNNLGQRSEIDQRPAMVIISSASFHDNDIESENNAKESMEVSDEDYDGSDSLNPYHTRRSSKPDIGSKSEEPSDSSVSSASSDYERNPGNPFTVHKNKYKQNWPYNHYMDGDHMNINPFGPQFGSLGPTGPELFFGRKWWYFNQDDYKPMG